MTTSTKNLPTWLLIVSGLFAVLELLVSIALVISPQDVIETVDLQVKGVDYLIYMWASRQFALGVIFTVATFKKSIPMLTLAYIFFLVMFVGDLLIGIAQHNNGMIISAVVMCAVAATLLYVLNKKK